MDKVRSTLNTLKSNTGGPEWNAGSAIEIKRALKYEKKYIIYIHITFFAVRYAQIFAGNTNTYMVTSNDLNPVILATKIRIVPHSIHRRTVRNRYAYFHKSLTMNFFND